MSDFNSYVEDFYKRYEHPTVGDITVGFSNIDPSQKTLNENSIVELAKAQVSDYVSKLQIHIDSGNIEPGTEDTTIPYSTIKPSEISHEQLGGLLGGSDNGHYHLTKNEYDKLDTYPDLDILPEIIKHNELRGIQGGKDGDYYHLTKNDVIKLQKLIETFISNYNDDAPAVDYQIIVPNSGEKNHEALQNLKGGNTSGHYHLTEDELNVLKKLKTTLMPTGTEIDLPEGAIDHEKLINLKGGTTNGHYHLSQNEVENLSKLTATLINSDGNVSLPEEGVTSHEALQDLLGGEANKHYHLTKAELDKLKAYPNYDNLNIPSTHDDLGGLQGGKNGEHYHLTQNEITKLNKLVTTLINSGGEVTLPEEIQNNVVTNHEQLTNLLGGNTGGHYHLTKAELDKLKDYPNYSNLSIPSIHDDLGGLQGGKTSEHYHLTEAELQKVQMILTELYPTGATKPVYPDTIAVTDNLTSTSAENALSANQGRILKGLIDDIVDNQDNILTTETFNTAVDARIINYYNQNTIIDCGEITNN